MNEKLMNEAIGKTVRFNLQPYHAGTMEITEVRHLRNSEHVPDLDFYEVRGRLIEGQTTNRLFGAKSHVPMDQNMPVVIPCITGWKIAQVLAATPEATGAALVYVYGV